MNCQSRPDLPGSPTDQHLAYYRAAYSAGIVGLLGSPNFRHGGTVNCVAYSPDGQRAVSASGDRSLILWDIETGRELRRLEGHQNEVNCCAFSPDGGRVLSGSNDSTLKLWDAQSGAELGSWNCGWPVYCVAFHPAGRLAVAALSNGTLALIDLDLG